MNLRCPDCRDVFPWDASTPFPEVCPLCKEYIGSDPANEVSAPFISLKGGAYKKAVDDVYRGMENGAEHRMNMAAEMTPGASREDFAALKITNMKDNLREGDVAVKEVVNPVTIRMDQMRANGLPVGFGANGAGLSGEVQSGAVPNAGIRSVNKLRSQHVRNVDPRQAGIVSSDRPALETTAPNYRPRV